MKNIFSKQFRFWFLISPYVEEVIVLFKTDYLKNVKGEMENAQNEK